jgi:hypothetical protein
VNTQFVGERCVIGGQLPIGEQKFLKPSPRILSSTPLTPVLCGAVLPVEEYVRQLIFHGSEQGRRKMSGETKCVKIELSHTPCVWVAFHRRTGVWPATEREVVPPAGIGFELGDAVGR